MKTGWTFVGSEANVPLTPPEAAVQRGAPSPPDTAPMVLSTPELVAILRASSQEHLNSMNLWGGVDATAPAA